VRITKKQLAQLIREEVLSLKEGQKQDVYVVMDGENFKGVFSDPKEAYAFIQSAPSGEVKMYGAKIDVPVYVARDLIEPVRSS